MDTIEEVRSIYAAAGEGNLIIKVFAEDVRALQDFMTKTIAKLEDVTVVSSSIIAKIIKEQPAVVLKPG